MSDFPPLLWYYVGNAGPFYYNPEKLQITDEAHPLYDPSRYEHSFQSEGQIKLGTAPSHDYHILRKIDYTTGGLSDQLLLKSPDGLHTAKLQIANDGVLSLYVDGQLMQTWP